MAISEPAVLAEMVLGFPRVAIETLRLRSVDESLQGELLNFDACIATLAITQDAGPRVPSEESATSQSWRPTFWDDPRCVRWCVDQVTHRIDNPILWLAGEYMASELYAGRVAGWLPEHIPLPPASSRSHVTAVLRGTAGDLPLPFHQGFGHFPGVSILCFPRESEPTDLYDAWLAAAASGSWWPEDGLFGCDSLSGEYCIPRGAGGFAAPFGDENRQHVVVAVQGISGAEIIASFGSTLGVSVVNSQATEADFRKWEWDFTLPEDVSD